VTSELPEHAPPGLRRLRDLDPRTCAWERASLRARSCPFCASQGEPKCVRPDQLQVNLCARCGTWFVSPAPDPVQLAAFYRDYHGRHRGAAFGATAYREKHLRNASPSPAAQAARIRAVPPLADLRLRELATMIDIAGARVLDVGCGIGQLAWGLTRLGARVEGVDIDASAVAFARDELGLAGVRHGTLDLVESSARFDLVVLQDVMEHVLEPRPLLERSLELLAPGGLGYVWTPNGTTIDADAEPLVLRADFEHMQFLQARTVQYLAGELGLEILHLEALGWLGSREDRPSTPGGARARRLPARLRLLPGFDLLRRVRHALAGRDPEREGTYHLFVVLRKPRRP
jgi:2-polyprenyl-3-methyl-5-hydroxy-6-metoxy-1,4-benzoquinol methylase